MTLLLGPILGLGEEPAAKLAQPTPEQLAWHDLELEMFLCLDPCTWQNLEYDSHSTPLAEIHPEKLDTDQWVRVAQSFGAKQVLFVAKHTGGFCWWQTETSNYGVRQIPWRGGQGDVVKDLSASCRQAGLRLALYLSPQDDQFQAGGGGRCRTPETQQNYNQIYRQQLTELLSRYGEVSEVWFDGSCVIEVADILKQYTPRAMIFQGPHATIRWVGNEEGCAPYPAWNSISEADARSGIATAQHGRPEGPVWMPLEVNTVNVHPHYWFWNNRPERRLRTLDELLDCYYRSVGHGGVFLLNQTPDTTGLIPDPDAQRAAEFGAEIARRFGKPLAETRGQGEVVELSLPRPTPIDQVILMEEIAEGERVREYVVEAWLAGDWEEVCRGSAIGHKKIDRLDLVETSKLRLRVTKSAAEPLIRRLAVFFVGDAVGERMGNSYWTLDETRGDVIRDAVGKREGKIVGAKWAEGKRGKALEFNGQGDYVNLGNRDVGAKDFSIAAWICPREDVSGLRLIVGKERSGTAPHQLRFALESGNRLEFELTGDGGVGLWPFLTEAGAVPTGKWTHIAVTRQGCVFTLYVNGQPAGTKSTPAVIRHANRLDLRIGARYPTASDAGGDSFAGRIDEIAFWDRALSAQELNNPETLPPPLAAGEVTLAQWGKDRVTPAWSDLNIDLTAGCKKAGQFEIEFRPSDGAAELEIQGVRYLFQGIDASEFLQRTDRPGVYHLNVTGVTGSMVLRATVRCQAGAETRGVVLLRTR